MIIIRRSTKWLIYAAITIIALAAALVLYWQFSVPQDALTLNKVPIPLVSNVAMAGDYVTLDISYCKNVNADGRVMITLVSERTQLILPISTDTAHRGCHTNAHVPLPIPPQATQDTYHYHFRVIYVVNPIRTITTEFDTASFQVQ